MLHHSITLRPRRVGSRDRTSPSDYIGNGCSLHQPNRSTKYRIPKWVIKGFNRASQRPIKDQGIETSIVLIDLVIWAEACRWYAISFTERVQYFLDALNFGLLFKFSEMNRNPLL
jgi:hypothetical protein